MTDTPKLTLSDVEEMVNSVARDFAQSEYGIPARALRVILWPTDKFVCSVERGPTAVIRLGILPSHSEFKRVLKNAVGLVASKKMWESTEIELVAEVLKRQEHIRRNLWRTMGFDPDLLAQMPKDNQMVVRVLTRVEAYHPGTGLREVVEVEAGQGGLYGAQRLAEARLARRVLALEVERGIAETHPWDLSPDHPEWVARTN